MKRLALLAGLATSLALAACTASPTHPASPAGDASASTSVSPGAGSAATTVDINDPSRPMFGGGIGNP